MYSTSSNSSDWNDRVNDDLAAFRARNNQRNNPNYVLEVEERLAARRAGLSLPDSYAQPAVARLAEPAEPLAPAKPEDSFSIVKASLNDLTPKRNWFGFKQR